MKQAHTEEVYSKEEREAMLRGMHAASDNFYQSAIRIGNHPFIEITGLMNEYIKACEEAHKQGIDFTQTNVHTGQLLPLKPHHIKYLNEKLECIFGGRIKIEAS